ncbi:MAG: hypothetical protein FVQ81_01955 [Candidatus Glassbacteria bacterium]|nr:hypothetical protein [Candidatus Glassbacteria bacterium]
MAEQLCEVHDTPLFCEVFPSMGDPTAKEETQEKWFCPHCRIVKLEARIEELSGLKFSDRNYGAMKSRVEAAEKERDEWKKKFEQGYNLVDSAILDRIEEVKSERDLLRALLREIEGMALDAFEAPMKTAKELATIINEVRLAAKGAALLDGQKVVPSEESLLDALGKTTNLLCQLKGALDNYLRPEARFPEYQARVAKNRELLK